MTALSWALAFFAAIDTDDRFVLCCNPEQADRDGAVRLVAQLEEAIAAP
ncbi:MAG TPA: hypothetical protein VGX23_30320 [Actinocrinis sp.]|nr:hypothetical protein [Actinocrinis sp.]